MRGFKLRKGRRPWLIKQQPINTVLDAPFVADDFPNGMSAPQPLFADIIPNILITTLALVAATLVIRGPTFSEAQAKPFNEAFQSTNLLTNTLGISTPPFAQDDWTQVQQQRQIYAETAANQLLTLRATLAVPFNQEDWPQAQSKQLYESQAAQNSLLTTLSTVAATTVPRAPLIVEANPRQFSADQLAINRLPLTATVAAPFGYDLNESPQYRVSVTSQIEENRLPITTVAAPFVPWDSAGTQYRVNTTVQYDQNSLPIKTPAAAPFIGLFLEGIQQRLAVYSEAIPNTALILVPAVVPKKTVYDPAARDIRKKRDTEDTRKRHERDEEFRLANLTLREQIRRAIDGEPILATALERVAKPGTTELSERVDIGKLAAQAMLLKAVEEAAAKWLAIEQDDEDILLLL